MADETPPKKKKKLLKKRGGDDAPPAKDAEELEEGGGGKRKLLILIGAAVLMLGVGAGAGFFAGGMMQDDPAVAEGAEAEEEEEDEEPEKKDRRHSIYVTVGKLLAAVEHQGSTRYIQAEVDLVGYSKEIMDDAQHNVPALRNRLLLLFSSQDFEEVRTIAGRERLRLQSLKAVNDVLELGPKGDRIEDVYFTAFVIQ